MVRVCYFCNNNSQSDGTKKRSYHSFPRTQTSKLQAWLLNMQHSGPVPTKHQLLCSDHFTDECFDRKYDRTVLLPSAVPTIFDLTKAKLKMPEYDRNSSQSVSQVPLQPTSSETSTVQCSWANNICEATYAAETEEDLNDIIVTDDDLENCTIKSEPSVVWEEELKDAEDPLAISDPSGCKEENQLDNIEGSNDSLYDSEASESHSLPRRRKVKRKPYTSLAASRRKLRKINVLPKKYRCKSKQLNEGKMKPLSTAILDEIAPAKAKYPPGFTHIGSPKAVSKFSEAVSKELLAQIQSLSNEASAAAQKDNKNTPSDCSEHPCDVETNDSDIQEMSISNCESNTTPVVSNAPSKQELEIADMLQRDKSELVDAIIMLQNAVRTQYERAETFRRKQRTLAQRLRRNLKKEKAKE